MNRYISSIISKFSILLGINCQENSGSGLAIQGFGLGSLARSLGLRYSSASIMAGSHVAVLAHVSSANWRPAGVARHVSG